MIPNKKIDTPVLLFSIVCASMVIVPSLLQVGDEFAPLTVAKILVILAVAIPLILFVSYPPFGVKLDLEGLKYNFGRKASWSEVRTVEWHRFFKRHSIKVYFTSGRSVRIPISHYSNFWSIWNKNAPDKFSSQALQPQKDAKYTVLICLSIAIWFVYLSTIAFKDYKLWVAVRTDEINLRVVQTNGEILESIEKKEYLKALELLEVERELLFAQRVAGSKFYLDSDLLSSYFKSANILRFLKRDEEAETFARKSKNFVDNSDHLRGHRLEFHRAVAYIVDDCILPIAPNMEVVLKESGSKMPLGSNFPCIDRHPNFFVARE